MDKFKMFGQTKKNLATLAAFLMLALMLSGQIFSAAAKGFLYAADKLGPRVLASELFLKSAEILNPRDAKNAFYIGLWYHKAHKLEKATKFYKKAAELDSKIANTHYQLARVYFASGKLGEALDEINKEIEVNPANKRSFYIRGLTYGYSGKLKEAEADFKSFLATPLAKQSNGWGGYVDLGWVLMRQKKYEEALGILKEAEGLFSPNTWVYNGLGGTYLALKDYVLSEEYYKKAYEGAKKMTIEEWLVAYPAHDPRTAEDGIKQITNTIEKNILLVQKKNAQKQ